MSSWPQYQVACFGPAPFLPMSHEEMDQLGWDSCDAILVTGDAYVGRPSFGMAICGRMLEAQGFHVGIIVQLDWSSKNDFMRLGKPNLSFGVTAGNMDSMIDRCTTDRRLRYNDACILDNVTDKRPDRAALVHTQCCKEAWKDVPAILDGIGASLHRTVHYSYWSDTVRRSVLVDSKTDILVFGSGKHPLVKVVYRLVMGEPISEIRDVRNTIIIIKEALLGWSGVDSTRLDTPGKIDPVPHPYGENLPCADNKPVVLKKQEARAVTVRPPYPKPWERTYVLLPSLERVKGDGTLYVHASRILHHGTNPDCARALVQKHGDRYVWINSPIIPLSTEEMGSVFALSYKRMPHPAYDNAHIPAYEMTYFSINIMRGCFGGCSFCSTIEHERRITQSCSEDSIINEIEVIRDAVPGFAGVISGLGGLTANMHILCYKSPHAEQACRRLSCVYPDICPYMSTNREPTINFYRRVRDLKGIKKILVTSGVRYDIAVEGPRYIKKLAIHHVGGYLKVAPRHTEEGPLSKMMKPDMGSYDHPRELFDTCLRQADEEQYLILYLISVHPGTRDEGMVNLALWLKKHRFRLNWVQNFYPSPLADLTTMYYTGKSPLARIGYRSEDVFVPKGDKQRHLHKTLLRYHDPTNWPLICRVLETMDKKHLIGGRRDYSAPASTIEEIHEARRQSRSARPTLMKRMLMATRYQTPAMAKKASSTQSHPANTGAKEYPKVAAGR